MKLNIGGFKNSADSDSEGLGLDLSKKIDSPAPSGDLETPKLDLETPKVNIETPKVDLEVPKVDLEAQKVDLEAPKVDLPKVDLENKSKMVDIELSTNDKSSLNTPSGDDAGLKTDLEDEVVLRHLSEKLGRTITSLDDLKEVKENPLEKDPYLKSLADWREKTGRPIEDWIKYQKDYSTLKDLDVARELLQHEYPTLTEDEIQFELKRNFIASETDLDDEATSKNLDLKKYASRGRTVLGELVSKLDTPSMKSLPPEIEKEVNYSKQAREHFAQSQLDQDSYLNNIRELSSKADSLPLKLSDDLTINFKLPEASRKALPNIIENAPHWKNEDGSWNHNAVVQDAIKISHFDEMMKLAYEQGVNSGKNSLIKDAKNMTLDGRQTIDGNMPNSSQGVVIEGLDNYLGNQGVKLRFGNKNK